MLKTPKAFINDPVLGFIAKVGNRTKSTTVIEEGVVQIGHFSLDIMIWGRNAPEFYMGYPEIAGIPAGGVCDSPQQFLDRFRKQLQDDKRTFVVSFTHIAKDPSNRGQGGGWRWHKWGEYIGTGKPEHEYLDDEEGFEDGVYVYGILQTDGPKIELDEQPMVQKAEA